MEKTIVTFDDFVERYKLRKLTIAINPKTIPIVMSLPEVNVSGRLAYKLCFYIGVISFWSILVLVFISWVYALAAFLLTFVIFSANKRFAISFMAKRMLENEEFFHYCLLNKFAGIRKNGHALIYQDGEVLDYGLFDEPEMESQSI